MYDELVKRLRNCGVELDCPLVPVPDYVDAIFSTNYTETITTGENREKTEENCGY